MNLIVIAGIVEDVFLMFLWPSEDPLCLRSDLFTLRKAADLSTAGKRPDACLFVSVCARKQPIVCLEQALSS